MNSIYEELHEFYSLLKLLVERYLASELDGVIFASLVMEVSENGLRVPSKNELHELRHESSLWLESLRPLISMEDLSRISALEDRLALWDNHADTFYGRAYDYLSLVSDSYHELKRLTGSNVIENPSTAFLESANEFEELLSEFLNYGGTAERRSACIAAVQELGELLAVIYQIFEGEKPVSYELLESIYLDLEAYSLLDS